ncbi:protein kinase [Streptomyces sp. NPDC020965]|uniref:protein kinase domain-containing protein n=1 Tax=Streptomyces sp. NPDC020965 TaxID=3365105 RepID=UPI0037B04C45
MNAWTVPGYTESRELGSGASGRVVLAVHDATALPVAVKYLAERLRTNITFVRDFRREAQLIGGLASPYVVSLYEYVEAPGGAAIVMELIDGMALRALLRQEGATGPEAALAVLKGSLLGLAAAHRAGVVHRDYKPENVLVSADGLSALVDFGIAVGSGSLSEVAGTPAYMAPEQWQGEPASPAADVYAATAVFHECLTGNKPYTGGTVAELALQHIDAPIPDQDAPEAVRPLIRRGLAKNPADRPVDATAFVAELEEIAGAAYGADWEERGQRRLAALAALLPLLLPSSIGGDAAGTTDTATTTLGPGAGVPGRAHVVRRAGRGRRGAGSGGRGRRVGRSGHGSGFGSGFGSGSGSGSGRWSRSGSRSGRGAGSASSRWGVPTGPAALVVTALVVLAGSLSFVFAVAGGPSGRPVSRALATTGATPAAGTSTPAPPTPGTPVPVAPSFRSDPSRSGPAPRLIGDPPTPPPTRNPAPGPGAPAPGPGTPSAAPTPRPSSSRSEPTPTASPEPSPTGSTTPPATRVKSVSVSDLRLTARAGAAATVVVTADGTGPITVTVTWFTSDTPEELGTPDGTETFRRSGAREYTITPLHTFRGNGCYVGVRATTDPAAGNGAASQQISRGCSVG